MSLEPAFELLAKLQHLGIKLWSEAGALNYRASAGVFDAALKAEVQAHKPALLQILQGPAVSARDQETYPLSLQQQRLWFISQLEPDSSGYHCPALIALPEKLVPELLQQAFDHLLQRHEVLRLAFINEAGQARAFIHSHRQVDVQQLHADNQEYAQQLLDRFFQTTFDLSKDCLVRAALLTVGNQQYLALCLHHIITDGWSMRILEQELMGLYRAALCNQPHALPALPLQYLDYSQWQALDLRYRILPGQQDFWVSQFKELPEPLELTTDFARPPIRSGKGDTYEREFEPSLLKNLERMAQARGLTLFMVSLGIFKLLLARFSQQWDICVGTPTANRTHSQLEPLIGFFVNTLALRSRMTPEMSVSDFLAQIKETCSQAFAHQELPLEHLLSQLQIPRDLSRSPLFQVMFALQTAGGALASTNLKPNIKGAKFDLNVSLQVVNDKLTLNCEYASELWQEESVARLFDSYEVLMRAVLADPERPLHAYPLLTPPQQRQLMSLCQGRQIQRPFADAVTLFKSHCADDNLVALRLREQNISYAELDRLSDQLAIQLSADIASGDYVALWFDRSFEMVTAIMAILKLGAAYLPIDPSLPAQRIHYILGDAKSPVLLTSDTCATPLPALEGIATKIHSFTIAQLTGTEHFTPRVRSPKDAIYVIYTSGSTGNPKGVINTDEGLFNRLQWMQDNFPIELQDKILQKTNYAFDVSVWEFIWPLQEGAQLVLAEPEGHKDPRYLQNLIDSEGISVLHFVPSMLGIFLSQADANKLQSLRAVFTSGEALEEKHRIGFQQLGLDCKLFNLYGPTEAAIDVTVWDCDHTPSRPGFVPIGYPIDNTSIYVLDPYLQPVPVGVAGEIYIGGVNLAQGYLNQPEKTAQSFIQNPFAANERLYRTGDKGRYDAKGAVEYLGRLDFQVKLRGLRIEIGEIEYRLHQHADIKQACVLVKNSQQTQEQILVAYVEASATLDIAAVKSALSQHLPAYMIPQRIFVLEQLPLNNNGKLDRKALMQLPLPNLELSPTQSASNQREKDIVAVWSDVLGTTAIGVEHNFFELGGTSLLMVQVQQQLEARLGQNIPLVKLFSYPSVRALANYLDTASDAPALNQDISERKAGGQRLANMRQRRAQNS